ncbi:hypothetical protein BDA96_05G101200 [Sorghum bicolor]|uniref:DUF7597 domain-containing protein n=1 Tax=Sorghum bicolor TaxID=4558 RepID=A0A921QXM1_SORBI|nr:hypothetical protein BDA96_05G101200 [Sorghum bicolor]
MKAQESADNEMQEVTLKCISVPPPADDEEATSSDITATMNAHKVSSVQVHPKEPWILTTHEGGNLRVWNYKTMNFAVCVAKFIPQEEWIMAGDGNGWIHVYSCDEYQDDTSFEAHDGRIMSLAVHPTDSYVLSSSHDDHLIKLWHWDQYWDFDKGPWACTRTFQGHTDRVSRLVFNREDPGYFASASWDGTVKKTPITPKSSPRRPERKKGLEKEKKLTATTRWPTSQYLLGDLAIDIGWNRPARGRVALGGEPTRKNEEYAIVSIDPMPVEAIQLRHTLTQVTAEPGAALDRDRAAVGSCVLLHLHSPETPRGSVLLHLRAAAASPSAAAASPAALDKELLLL